MLRDSLRGYLGEHAISPVVAAAKGREGPDTGLWQAFARDLGILGVAVPSRLGGLGGGAVEQMIIMEELGRALVRQPFLETAVQCAEILSRSPAESAVRILADIVAGKAVVAYAWAEAGAGIDLARIGTTAHRTSGGWQLTGTKPVVAAAPLASHLIVLARLAGGGGLGMFLVDKAGAGVSCSDLRLLDGGWASDVELRAADVVDSACLFSGDCSALAEEILDRAVTMGAAEMVGIMSRLIEETIAYLKQRRQFGRALADFQVLRHRVADMHIQLDLARSAVVLAAASLPGDPEERRRAAAGARVIADEAGLFVGQSAIQLHGAMGMTDDLAIGHFVKRLMVISADFGNADLYLARYR